MRKFLSRTAGATFHEETPNVTICVRKTCVEIIFKLDKGLYAIVNVMHAENDEVLLIINWDQYLKRIQNPDVQIPRIKKCCQKLYDALVIADKGKVQSIEVFDSADNKNIDAFGIFVSVPANKPLISLITPEIHQKARELAQQGLDMYHELYNNPPFPAWKPGLKEVWN